MKGQYMAYMWCFTYS